MIRGNQTWQKSGLWLGVIYLTAKPHISLTMRLLEVTWTMNSTIYLFLRRLLSLNLTRWWFVKLKSRRRFNQYMIGFLFSYRVLVGLKKFGEDTLFLKRFHFWFNFINFLKNICVDQVVLKIRVLNQEKQYNSRSGI